MELSVNLIVLITVAYLIHYSYGQCEMDGVDWRLPQRFSILDTDRGEVFAQNTNGITGISGPIELGTALNGGPYMAVSHADSHFSITTTDAFADYEEYETAQTFSITVTFSCSGAADARLVFIIDITDTNNNDPIFRPNSSYEFNVIPPLPPGFRITDCWSGIIARDIDLTTSKVDFNIFNTSDFEITYSEELSTVPKEFQAMLTTTTFIRCIAEPIEFMISATDVDSTDDPRRTTYATVRITSNNEFALPEELVFSQPFYLAEYTDEHKVGLQETISLQRGFYKDVGFRLRDYSEYFSLVNNDNEVSIEVDTRLPPDLLRQSQLLLVVLAERNFSNGASATVVLKLPEAAIISFSETTYMGEIYFGLLEMMPLTLTSGYELALHLYVTGPYSSYFSLEQQSNEVIMSMTTLLPPEIFENTTAIMLNIEASHPEAESGFTAVFLQLGSALQTATLEFSRAYYVGQYSFETGLSFEEKIELVDSSNETVTLALSGDHSELFDAVESSENSIEVILRDSNHIPAEVAASSQQLILVLSAERPGSRTAQATIIILLNNDAALPVISFESESYVIRVEMGQTGLVGSVQASADNGEEVTYSLLVNNDLLREKISISSAGELELTSAVSSGIYSFQVIATSVSSQSTGSASVHLVVDELAMCGNETVLPPLIVIDRDEEQPLRDLVLLNPAEHPGCRFSLTNRWPADQPWLYVNETGLHARAIDREDPSIAFMALSQVQVELTMICENDVTRTKRSLDEELDPYDYGSNTWLLGETINFNPRRSVVNLIVNDINDNSPIFVGKESEPLIIGYPAPGLEQVVSPRSLAELKATDADIGENAAIVYWTSEPDLAVSSTTGFVHVRTNGKLENNQILTVHATDLNGLGHTGSISLMVKFLDINNIAVITVRNAFLEDEVLILDAISNGIGYELKALRSAVTSEIETEQRSRMKREVNSTRTGASLNIFVYGLLENEPVTVEVLKNDIGKAAVITDNIASVLSLKDHLEGLLICDHSGRDAGLLAATIALSVLLFVLIVAIIVWFVLTRKMRSNYEEFSDVNSLVSRNDSLSQPPKHLDTAANTKLSIEELNRSERRLQDMLMSAPIEETPKDISFLPTKSNRLETRTSPVTMGPVVIQDKLKDADEESDEDEFGERKAVRRKSVVTFNENVEKIIVDQMPGKSEDIYEVFKL